MLLQIAEDEGPASFLASSDRDLSLEKSFEYLFSCSAGDPAPDSSGDAPLIAFRCWKSA